MFQLSWLPEALADLQKQFDFLNEKNPEAASRAVRAILAPLGNCDFIRINPVRKL